MKLKRLITILSLFFTTLSLYAQMDKSSMKLIKKADRFYKKEQFEKAASVLKVVLNRYPINRTLWDMYQEITFRVQMSQKSMPEEKSDESIYAYYNAIYYANMSIPFNINASAVLRRLYIDKLYFRFDSIVPKSSALYQQGNKALNAHNYQEAIELYERSYSYDSTNCAALIRLGEVYVELEYYGRAIQYFRQASTLQPLLGEPIKFWANALLQKGESDRALEICKNGLLVYPEEAVFSMMQSILNKKNRELQRNWVLRLAPINNPVDYYHRGRLFDDALHFEYYKSAMDSASQYYDINGLLKKNVGLPISPYLEVYCWEKMLANTQDMDIPALEYARYIQKMGLLEPYVLIGLFNVDLYAQYRHFIQNKRSVAENYINDFLISNGF